MFYNIKVFVLLPLLVAIIATSALSAWFDVEIRLDAESRFREANERDQRRNSQDPNDYSPKEMVEDAINDALNTVED